MKNEITLFTDTGGILILDPTCASSLLGDALSDLNVVLDPDGRTDQAAGFNPERWQAVWSEAASRLRHIASQGAFVLVLSGEGTFHVRVQDEDLTPSERVRLVRESTGIVTALAGTIAITDGMVLFEGESEIPADRAEFLSLPMHTYQIQIAELASPPTLTRTVGVHGSSEYPALVFVLKPSKHSRGSGTAYQFPELFHRLERHQQGHRVYEPGWNCYGEVARVSGGVAYLSLMLTESVSSGHGEVIIPESMAVSPGDFLLVNLVSNDHGHWKCQWVGQCEAT